MAARDDVDAASSSSRRNGASENPRAPVQQRLHDGFRTDRRYLSQMVLEAQNERSARVEAVLELKQDLDASSARIAAQSAAIQAQRHAEKTHQARTHQSLLDQGKNPYEVARRKVVQREARRERSKIERNMQERETKLLGRLENEKVLQRRKDKIEAENRAYERKYQREMGRAAQEERTSAYLLSRTGKEALDPTGKLVRVYPSQETTVKDYSFGLGRSAVLSPEHRRRVVAKVLSKAAHAGTEPTSLLLPRRRTRHSQQESEDPTLSSGRSEKDESEDAELKASARLVMPPLPGVKPGHDLRKVNHALLPSNDVKLPPIPGKNARRSQDSRLEEEDNPASEDVSNSNRTRLKKSRGRSVLEERQLAKARQRQKDARFAQSQVVWGKAFTGNAFLANPSTLWFKDFDVGRPLTLSFTLTNISNTFNQFRLLAMDDEVLELFDIVYEKPGRMSAGMSCSLRMTFTGVEGRDFDTSLSVAAPTGVFQIPVRCTCKKAVPVLSQREVRFPEVVAGERATVSLTLANEGALPLEFRVRRVPSASSETPRSVAHEDDLQATKEGDDAEASENADAADTEAMLQDSNPREDEGEAVEGDEPAQDVVDGGNNDDEVGRQSPPASRAASGASTKSSATRITQVEAVEPEAHEEEDDDDVRDPLTAEELELVERVRESTRFKPDGAEEPVRFTRRGVVEPYSSSSVSFTFAPAVAMTLESEQYILEFPAASSSCGISSPDLRKLASICVSVSGVASEVPVFVAQSKLNFRCCAYGKLYRHQLVVCNRGKVALKIQVQVPKVLAKYVEFNPGFGFVQAAANAQTGKFPVQVKFRPEERMWRRIERAGLGSKDLGMLAVPIQVVVPDQVVPVFFLLAARLTSSTLQLDVKTGGRSEGGLHFGSCCVGHSVSHELTISNAVRVPQRIGVTTLPKDVTVADVSAGVGVVLLPGETRTLRVVYEPSFPGSMKAAGHTTRAKAVLTLWSSTFNQEYTLPCSGTGVASDLVFSHSVVRLGATSLGQTQTCNVKLTNQSDHHTRLVELRLPPEATPFLRITPLVARLAPRESVRLEIDFEPTEDIFKLDKARYLEEKTESDRAADDGDTSHVASATSVEADSSPYQASALLSDWPDEDSEARPATPSTDDTVEPRSCHHTWTVLCFHQLEGSADTKRSSKPETRTPLQALEVRTTVIEPLLTPSETVLDFGQVAIGQMLVRELTLELAARATDGVLLRAQPLHVLGAFRVIGSLREVSPGSDSGKKRTIRVEFEPRTPLIYEDELELTALGVDIRVRLRGEGINPSLTLTPADGSLDFQDVLARTRSVRDLVLANGSAFPLAFSIEALAKEDESMTTSTGLPVFTFSPTSAVIPENGSITVHVGFQPDHQRPGHYANKYRIKVPNESEQHVVSVAGRCWENQLYVFFAPTADTSPLPSDTEAEVVPQRPPLLTPRPVEDLFDLPPSVPLSQLPHTIGVVGDLPAAGLRKPVSSFVLTFAEDNVDAGDAGRITKTLFIGSTTPSSGIYGGLDEVPSGAAANANANAGGSVGSFELVVDAASPHAKLFTLEPARGAIAAGQQLAVQVTYAPPAATTASETPTPASSARSTVSAPATSARAKSAQRRPELEVVQWVQVRVQCTLKGGSLWRTLPQAGGPPTQLSVAASGTAAPAGHLKGSAAHTGASPATDGVDTRTVTVILRARLET